MADPETFWSLLHNAAHWEFEIFLMVLFDGLIGALIWPFVRKHWQHHIDRDKKEKASMPKPTWGNIALHYFIGSLMLLDAMWLVQLHYYVFASVAALAAIVVLGVLLREII